MTFRAPHNVLQSCGAPLIQPAHTLTPFLYPRNFNLRLLKRFSTPHHSTPRCLQHFSTGLIRRNTATSELTSEEAPVNETVEEVVEETIISVSEAISQEILDPDPDFLSVAQPTHPHSAFTNAPFTDIRTLSLVAGDGGNGCISFLREKFVRNGPPNGGDGGQGGSIYIQAIYGETSLHKLNREGVIKATHGKNGRGSSLNGKRGENVVIQVPVGTVVREISRWDPTAEEMDDKARELDGEEVEDNVSTQRMRDHGPTEEWLHYPNSLKRNLSNPHFTEAAYPVHHHTSSSQLLQNTHPTRVYLDLTKPTPEPILLVPGAPGGLGNPHFVSPKLRNPKFATRGGKGARMKIELELKILADVGLVGLPNAGKSSFLRAISRRKARVGEWAFTTLSPNIGTIVIDESRLPPVSKYGSGKREKGVPMQPRFTIADIPGLIRDAHLNKGLGHGFLRHVERARVLSFVIDLSRSDPVEDIKGLWREVIAYEEGWSGISSSSTSASVGMLSEMAGNTNTSSIEPIAEEDLKSLNPELQKVILSEQAPVKEEIEEEMVFYPGALAQIPLWEDPLAVGKKQQAPKVAEKDPLRRVGERQKMSQKPWFVIANKADLPGTEEKYWALKAYVDAEGKKRRKDKDGRDEIIGLIPISALKGEGVDRAVDWMKGMLGFAV